MPSFTIFDDTIIPQGLGNGEDGFVGQNGSIVTSGPSAPITLTGNSDLIILGTVTSFSGYAIFGVGTFLSANIQIGATGQVVSGPLSAISVENTVSTVFLANDGLISGRSHGITVIDDGGATDLSVVNTGTITSSTEVIVGQLGDGDLTFSNSGTIALARPGFQAIVVDCSRATFVNSGSILGTVELNTAAGGFSTFANSGQILGAVVLGADNENMTNSGLIDLGVYLQSGNDSLTNTGVIHGDIALGSGIDSFTNRGGRVTGTIDGGDGSDTYRIDRDDLTIVDTGTFGTDTVQSSVTYVIGTGIENLVLTGSADIRGFGNDTANTITGNAGDNLIKGRGGADVITGGEGDDTLLGGAGSDTIMADDGDDLIQGGNALGIDVFDGGLAAAFAVDLNLGIAIGVTTGNDTLSGIEDVLGTQGNDTITGSAVANTLFGRAGDDSIAGGLGNDTLSGELGADTLVGGSGNDIFLWQVLGESTFAFADTVRDFRPGRDVIDLSVIDANGIGAGEGAFAFGGAAFLPAGQASIRVLQDVPNNATYVDVRDSAGSEIDMRIILTGLLTLTAGDFVL